MMFATATSSSIFEEDGSNISVRGVFNISFKHHNPLTFFINQLKKMVVDSREETQQPKTRSNIVLVGVQYR